MRMHNLTQKLQVIAEMRVLTTSQFCDSLGTSLQVGRRWIRQLEQKQYIRKFNAPFTGSRGRSEQLLQLEKKGSRLLASELLNKIAHEDLDQSLVKHQLLLNSIRTHFQPNVNETGGREMQFWGFNSLISSPLPIRENLDLPKGHSIDFIPDAVMCLRQGSKSCLFYVEADCGSESLSSESATSIEEKVHNYILHRGHSGHLRWKEYWPDLLTGYRVLFVTQDTQRSMQILKLLNEHRYTHFLWVTDIDTLTSKGTWLIPHQNNKGHIIW